MNRFEANQILDEHKQGIRICTISEVTRALRVCGDLERAPQKYYEPPVEYGLYQRLQSSHMAQGAGIGERNTWVLSWNSRGILEKHQGNQ